MIAADPAGLPHSKIAPSLRALLREQTSTDHDRLDEAMGVLDLADAGDYACFLRIQLAAREGWETWLKDRLDDDGPPQQSHLIRADLKALDASLPSCGAPVGPLPDDADLVGACWALAGSHLGNRMMLARLAGRVAHDWPVSFLSDCSVTPYWAALRQRLARPALTDNPAIPAARAVFATFVAAAVGEGLIERAGLTVPQSLFESGRAAA